MKKILLLVFVLSMSLAYAQRGGGGMGGPQQGGGMGQRGGGMQQQEEMPEFNATQVAGIFKYDAEEAMKKSKIKKDKNLIQNVSRAIGTYNIKMDEIALLNKDNFDTLNVYVNTTLKSKRGQRGNQQMGGDNNSRERYTDTKDDPKALINAKIQPAKDAVKKAEQNLNKTLEALLSEKQYGKWLKYQEKTKEEKQPKTASNSGQGEQGRSMGGPPGGGMR
ncbi:hypothetical protein ACFSKN_02965 [Mariniflexile gromovii]|uniref:Uncharacterized protein n=1 Tax=Mariniflexile gromovii TaxID=362523 RepID=A0ABS4BPQ5_9FLAO|nr:hypothetical protein [Mariniflexile gromovii]MBP0902567.1 hypothetical protein [Mariniflexile gromovii]